MGRQSTRWTAACAPEALVAMIWSSMPKLVCGVIDGATLAESRRRVTESGLAPSSQRVAVAALRTFLRFGRMVEAYPLPQEAVSVALRTPKGGKRHSYTHLVRP